MVGLTSAFGYGPDDLLNTLTTPYGTTSFRQEPNEFVTASSRFVEATDPLGATERIEFRWQTPELPRTLPSNEVPVRFANWNVNLDHCHTYQWDKRAWAAGPHDLAAALQRLVRLGVLTKDRQRANRIVDRPRLTDDFLRGYADVLRPHLEIGRFRAPEREPERFLQQFAETAEKMRANWAVTGAPGRAPRP